MFGDYQVKKTGRENNFESIFAAATASAACDTGAISVLIVKQKQRLNIALLLR